MSAQISAPRTDAAGLRELAPLWKELHRHHREVSAYSALVEDYGVSWEARLSQYRRLLEKGGSYITATGDDGQLVAYAMVALEINPDDTFESAQGVAEVPTLVVAQDQRSAGIGRALLEAAERLARERGFDTIKIAVMAGNERAQAFYENAGYQVAEHLMMRRLHDG